jgi:hypothetical protein
VRADSGGLGTELRVNVIS